LISYLFKSVAFVVQPGARREKSITNHRNRYLYNRWPDQ